MVELKPGRQAERLAMSTKPIQPSLAELTDRMLKRRANDVIDATEAEVEPHEVLNGFRTDPRTAYTDAVLPLTLLGISGVPTTLPPEWASYAHSDLGTVAVPMAAGLFPQRVRDLNALLSAADMTVLAPQGREPVSGFSSMRMWVQKSLTATATNWLARGIGHNLGVKMDAQSEKSAAAQNDAASDHWLSGRHAEAVAQWLAMPDSPVAAFNRGMSLLFTGRSTDAVPHLRQATVTLPDTSGWSHLAQLYLALAESRR
jgi:hypothetical protein